MGWRGHATGTDEKAIPLDKTAIVEELGSGEVLLPSLVNAALSANDQVKYCFALVVAARARADEPLRPAPTLRVERLAAGVEDDAFDAVVGDAVRCGADGYLVPGLDRVVGLVRRGLEAMVRPLAVAAVPGLAEIRRRLDDLLAGLPSSLGGPVPRAALDRLTSGDRRAGDSVHLLVLDLHKALNTLQADLAEESVEGAAAYGLTDLDRALVAAFMRGVHRTSALRLDHPGLSTTATRLGDRLVLQNDLGQTDAHVVVVAVEGLTVTVTYTDVHLARLEFFRSMLDAVTWTDTLSRRPAQRFERDLYHLTVGTAELDDVEALGAFLTHLGSRLVFLIDWNRARKRLRTFVPDAEAVGLLRWAADQEVGHLAFLTVVDEAVIHDALDLVGRFPLCYGEPLHRMIGTDRAVEYFRWALRATSEGVRGGTSRLALRDEVEAELARCFRSADEDLAGLCEHHAALAVDAADLVRDCLAAVARHDAARAEALAARAAEVEREADALVVRVREIARHVEAARFFSAVLAEADDVVDALEEACAALTVVPGVDLPPDVVRDVDAMAALARRQGESLRDALGLLRSSATVTLRRTDLEPLLEAVDGVVDLERDADEQLRRCRRDALGARGTPTAGTFTAATWAALEAAGAVERATDAAAAAGFVVRDHVLGTLRG